MGEENTVLGVGLRDLRRRAGLTQRELVDQACAGRRVSGLVEAGLSHWERGQRVPLPPQLLCLFKVLMPAPENALALLKSISDYRYAGLLHILTTVGGSPAEQVQHWEHWAERHPLHPPRGQFWAEVPAADSSEEDPGEEASLGSLLDGSGATGAVP